MMSGEVSNAILFALGAGFLWGVSPSLLKRGLVASDVSTATLISQYASTGLLIAVAAAQGELWSKQLTWPAFVVFAAAGVAASFGKIFLNKGIDTVGASKSVSVKNSSPIVTVVLGAVLLGERVDLPIFLGVTFIVGGVLLLTTAPRRENAPNRVLYFMYPLLSAFCFGINPILKKGAMLRVALPALGTLINHVTSLAFMLTGGRLLQIRPSRARVWRSSLVLFGLSGLCEGVASLFTYYALQYGPAVLVAPIWRISPLITFILAHFTLKGLEHVTRRDGLAAVFIVGGVWVLSLG
jgi:uncharacterized membrane protein